MTEEQKERLAGTIIIKEPEDKEPYAIEDSTLQLDIAYEDDDSDDVHTKVFGSIQSSVYIDNTELEYAKTYSFEVYGVRITHLSVNTRENTLVYYFVADRYEITEAYHNGKEEG